MSRDLRDFLATKDFAENGWQTLTQVLASSGELQTIHTPYKLCDEIISKLSSFTDLKTQSILVLFNLEFIDCLTRIGIPSENIAFVADSYTKELAAQKLYNITEVYNVVYSKAGGAEIVQKIKKQFDVVIMNPPYQSPSENKGAGHVLWHKFVDKALDLTRSGGFLCAVHPAGWRRPTGEFIETGSELKSRQMHYLSMHSIEDGKRIFGQDVTTNFDWYVLENSPSCKPTSIKTFDETLENLNIADLPCIPNGEFKNIMNLFHFGANSIEIIDDRSSYGADKPHVSKEKTDKFKYPCIYSLPQKGIQLRWSSTNKKGHFGVPKIIFSNGASPQIIIDASGEYGLTQWAFGIVDDVENLPKIKAAMESEAFVNLCRYMRFTLDKYDVKFLSCLRKDFWREFV